MHKLNQKQSYRSFVNKRDDLLEQLLTNSQIRIADKTNQAFANVMITCNANYSRLQKAYNKRHEFQHLDNELQRIFDGLSNDIIKELMDLRRKTYLFTYVSEHRAVQDQLGKNTSPKVDQLNLNAAVTKDLDGSSPVHKIDHEMSKIKRTIITKLELALIQERPIDEAMGMVYLALPKRKPKNKKAPLKKVKATEAGFKKWTKNGLVNDDSFSTGLVMNLADNGEVKASDWVFDKNTWDEIIRDYEETYIPLDRGPLNVVDLTDPRTGDLFAREYYESDEVYGWQIERDVTNDFVQQVREGQIDAANENGINDFIVISILDDKLCDACCDNWGCSDFDGKLVSEIEAMTGGAFSSPPYHFNCRCALAPASKDMGLVDESESKREFDEWLNDETRVSTTR